MPNSSNNLNSLKEDYCQGNGRPEWCTQTSNSENDIINKLLKEQKQRNKEVTKKVEDTANKFRKATNSSASVNRPETREMKELYERIAAHEGKLREAEADLEQAKDLKAAVISGQSAASEPAAGGARKSRKHKRTRKHMRKHTRKHKVMKSKMTKSKSKKVMQKGGTIHKTHKTKIKKELERLKEGKVATREIELRNLGERKSATHVIEKMKEEEKKRNRRKIKVI